MGGKGNYPKILGNENIRVKNDITKKDNTNGTFFFFTAMVLSVFFEKRHLHE
jgi:hypothetical protein